ncbi:MAG: hypothetical protein AB7T17_07095 [Geobacter sp.]
MSKTAEILGGYILLSRQLLNSDIWRKPPHYLKIWVWMLMTAHWADGDFERGQLCTSYAELQELGVHKSGNRTEGRFTTDQVRSAISWLVETGAIKTEKTRHGLMITIQNYDEYQNPANYVAGGNSGHQPGTTPNPGPDPTHKQAQHIDSAIKNKRKANPGTAPETTPETSRTPHLYINNNQKDIPASPKSKRLPSGDHQLVVSWWCMAYRRTTGKPYTIAAKDGAAVKALLRDHDLQTVVLAACFLLMTDDQFLRRNRTLPMLLSSINRIHSQENSHGDGTLYRDAGLLPPAGGPKFGDWLQEVIANAA